jgi:Ca-activated chloride channel family protein
MISRKPFPILLSLLLSAVFFAVPRAEVVEATGAKPATAGPAKPIGKDAPKGAKSAKSAEEEEIARLLQGRYVQTVAVDMVMVPALVLDRKGRPVLDLRAEDFALFDEGHRQKIDYFGVDRNEPLSVAFLLDVSGSMRMSGAIDSAKEVVRYFLSRMRAVDEACLIAFADKQVAMLTDFTADRTETLKYLNAVKAYGQTALNDAVAATPELVTGNEKARRAIVLLTDGVDNFSALPLDQAMASARAVDVPFYTIGFSSNSRDVDGKKPAETEASATLRQIADETGGSFFLIHDPDEMKEAAARIEEELRSQYVIGYAPTGEGQEGRFRRLSLIAHNGRYSVRSRSGYIR